MRLVKIKNIYLFKSNNPEGTHTYAVYWDSYIKRNPVSNYITLQVKKNFLSFCKPKASGVEDKTFRQTIDGKSIDEKYLYKTNTRLNKWDMDRLLWGKGKYKNKG